MKELYHALHKDVAWKIICCMTQDQMLDHQW